MSDDLGGQAIKIMSGVKRLDEDDGQSIGLADAARGKVDTLHGEGFLA
jgi:hypothetical protein